MQTITNLIMCLIILTVSLHFVGFLIRLPETVKPPKLGKAFLGMFVLSLVACMPNAPNGDSDLETTPLNGCVVIQSDTTLKDSLYLKSPTRKYVLTDRSKYRLIASDNNEVVLKSNDSLFTAPYCGDVK